VKNRLLRQLNVADKMMMKEESGRGAFPHTGLAVRFSGRSNDAERIAGGGSYMKHNVTKKLAALVALGMTLMQCTLLPAQAADTEKPDFTILGAVGDFSAEETQKIAARIYDGLAAHKDDISLTGKGMPTIAQDEAEALGEIYRSVISGWDVGILTLKNSMSYRISYTGIIDIMPSYLVEDDEYDSTYTELMEMLDTITAGVDSNWSEAEKALYLHEWMTVHYDYDNNSYSDATEQALRHTAYGMLKRNMAVCEGYAWLYELLLRRVGVESMMVESDSLNHAWNLLYIDDAWYHVDVTWDDCYALHPGLVSHSSFLKDNAAMEESGHTGDDWALSTGTPVSDLNVSSLYNDGFWNDSIAAVQPYNGNWLAIRQNTETLNTGWFSECDFDAADGSVEITNLMSLNEKWYVSGESGSYYRSSYITASVYNGIIYYTTPNSVFALCNNTVIWLFNLTDEQKENGHIYGSYVDDGVLYYYVSSNSLLAPVEYSVALQSYEEYVVLLAGDVEELTEESETETEEMTEETEDTTESETETEEMTEETEATTESETETEEMTEETEATTESETETEEITEETEATTESETETEELTEETEDTTESETETEEITEETETTTESETETEEMTEETEATTESETETEEMTEETEATTESETETEEMTGETEATTESETETEEMTEETETTTESETETEEMTEETETTTESETESVRGDMNGDGKLTLVDLLMMKQYLLGLIPLDEEMISVMDLTQDGCVDAFDFAYMKYLFSENLHEQA
jgi:hypothetical protein